MARTPAKTAAQTTAVAVDNPPTPPVAAPAATPAPAPAPAAFDWEILPEAEVVEYIRASAPRIDVEKETPAPIKARIDASYAAYDEAYKAVYSDEAVAACKSDDEKATLERKATEAANKSASRTQRFGNPDQAKEFVKLARRYAKFKGWTLKGDVLRNDPKTVGFRAKYPETRTRLATDTPAATPATETPVTPAA